MSEIVVPSLSSSGFISNTAEKADRLLSYFFVNEASQSELYFGQITSLPDLIQKNNNETFVLEKSTTDLLKKYFSRYFQNVEVQARTDKPQPGDENRTNLTIYVAFTDNGKSYSIGRLVQIVDSKIAEIVHINNSGDI
jgi:hypothetical protein